MIGWCSMGTFNDPWGKPCKDWMFIPWGCPVGSMAGHTSFGWCRTAGLRLWIPREQMEANQWPSEPPWFVGRVGNFSSGVWTLPSKPPQQCVPWNCNPCASSKKWIRYKKINGICEWCLMKLPAQSPNASGGTAVDDEKLNQKSFTELVSPCRSFHSSGNRYTAQQQVLCGDPSRARKISRCHGMVHPVKIL